MCAIIVLILAICVYHDGLDPTICISHYGLDSYHLYVMMVLILIICIKFMCIFILIRTSIIFTILLSTSLKVISLFSVFIFRLALSYLVRVLNNIYLFFHLILIFVSIVYQSNSLKNLLYHNPS